MDEPSSKSEPLGRGRPPHQPTETTRRQVEMMAAFGNTEVQIGAIIGISDVTLRRHYATELEFGHAKANNAVAANLFKQATKDDPRAIQAIQFWLRCRAGWSEYAPPPGERAPTGKKELAQIAAETAAEQTGWSGLVN